VGFILTGGEIVEVSNVCHDPANGFDVSDRDLAKYCDESIGTWHTHPEGTKLLSVGDYESYVANDELIHFIIAPDGVAIYKIDQGVVLNHPVPA
jgi:proteasome lid subunit RPN8/RPN11